MSEEEERVKNLEQSLDRVNSWIGNCDQKAGYLLATIGVIMAILFSSDFAIQVKDCIIKPFLSYLKDKEQYELCWMRLLFASSAILSMLLSFFSSMLAIGAITATCDSGKIKTKNSNLLDKSYLFWGDVSKMKYDDFMDCSEYKYEEDLRSQVYINSLICSKKFVRYNIACILFKLLLPFLFFAYILFLFI